MSQEHDLSLLDENEQIAQRKLKLRALRDLGHAYPNNFHRQHLLGELRQTYADLSAEDLEQQAIRVKVAGRIMTRRIMGKASFVHLQDMSDRLQAYIARDLLPEGMYAQFKTWDLGDIVGIEGVLFKTKTGELSIKADHIQLLTKALRPLPDKFHGLTDHEQRFRQRYLDLLVNENTRRIFKIRSELIASLRRFLDEHNFMEVETPMMHSLIGGAAAKPFITHHNTLHLDLYLRIAPELYLKRLVVGGFEKVYEINRNFRNEGISTRHNPEFTMLEFYQAYANYEDFMAFTEKMMRILAEQVLGSPQVVYQGIKIDFAAPFDRFTMREAICHYQSDINIDDLTDEVKARALAERFKLKLKATDGIGKIQMELFELLVEDKLEQPTFITEFPAEVSPLARASDADPSVTDRFELYIAGKEIANGFSELNDPEDQAARFRAQLEARKAGDEETMDFDEDYITALEHGLPPTAGEGIGIDRLTMIFTDSPSIRDVILFPQLKPR